MLNAMNIVHDWEFDEDGETIRPLSCGLVRDDGRQLYVIFKDNEAIGRSMRNEWLIDNVLCHFPIKPRHDTLTMGWVWDKSHPDYQYVMDKRTAFARIARFIQESRVGSVEPELWAWYSAYDHVRLAQCFGRMINLPKGLPMYTNDLKTLERMAAQKFGVRKVDLSMIKKSAEHRAIDDAEWGMRALRYFSDQLPYVPLVRGSKKGTSKIRIGDGS